MKTLVFLVLASLIVFIAGLTLVDAQSGSASLAPPIKLPAVGSAKLKEEPATPKSPAAVKLDPELRPKPSALLAAMEADNLCEAAKIANMEFKFDGEQVPSFLHALGASPALQELFAAKGPIFAPDPKKKTLHKITRLYTALSLGGFLITGKDNGKNGLTEAHRILLEIEGEEPANAAYPAARVGIEKKLGLPLEKIRETAKLAASGSYFDLLLLEHLKEIERARWQSATHHLVLSIFLEQAQRVVGFYSMVEIFSEIDRKFQTTYGKSLGETMMQEGQKARRSHYFLGFDGDVYATGRAFAADYEQPFMENLSYQKEGRESWPQQPYIHEASDCNRQIYDDYYHQMRGLL